MERYAWLDHLENGWIWILGNQREETITELTTYDSWYKKTKQDRKLEVFFSSFKTWNKIKAKKKRTNSQGWLPFCGNINSTRFQPSQIWTEKWCVFPPPCICLNAVRNRDYVGSRCGWTTKVVADLQLMSHESIHVSLGVFLLDWHVMFWLSRFLKLFGKNLAPDPLGRLRAWTCRDSWRYSCYIVPTMI